jgi:hypothetical protein
LTHEGLHAAPSWRTAAYLRDLLMTCGVLPTIDKQLLPRRNLDAGLAGGRLRRSGTIRISSYFRSL